ncbi:hypothetical protein HPB52_008912 [Rhipicephalus sanguineus]|uniref:Uncharacterized protein n=1 Tax=Rhipicephalus sanguineus TaxID=34632 RepID=A0A9D4PYT5_RHISA|nr:hypothetical protein HPB52_008912 [Rhipicephalus sanguineus]
MGERDICWEDFIMANDDADTAEPGFVQPEASEHSERSPEPAAPEGEEDDMAFLGLLPSEVELADYVTIDDGVVVAGHLNDDEIISTALGEMDEASDEDPCDELRLS